MSCSHRSFESPSTISLWCIHWAHGMEYDNILMEFGLRRQKNKCGRKRSLSSPEVSGLPKVPQNSAEPLGFCRQVLQNVSHTKKPVEERFCRTPSFSGPAKSSPKWASKPPKQRSCLGTRLKRRKQGGQNCRCKNMVGHQSCQSKTLRTITTAKTNTLDRQSRRSKALRSVKSGHFESGGYRRGGGDSSRW